MKLFLPDNHSRDEVNFHAAPRDQAELASAAWTACKGTAPAAVEVIEGANINSANFRIGNRYLKVVLKTPGKSHLFAAPEMISRLGRAGVPVAELELSVTGQPITGFQWQGREYLALLQAFQPGNFCPGTWESVEEVVRLWPGLAGALEGMEIREEQKNPWKGAPPSLGPLLLKADETKDEWSPLLREQSSFLLDLEGSLKDLESKTWGLHHIDLHPHNFLFEGNSLRLLLDLESFRRIPLEMSLGFCAYKLIRKGIANSHFTLEKGRERLAGWVENRKTAGNWASKEILRRIALILSLHYEKGEKTWTGDLPKHLAGLHEISALFS